jgi:cation diffusion facilitator family transporter
MLRNVPRRSRAAIRSASKSESPRTILIALGANIVIAVAKLIAGLMSGSIAMLAEAAHSAADSINEVLLGISLRRAKRPADSTHPLGHGRERFLWAFMAAIASFLIGGCVSIFMAIHEMGTHHPPGNVLASAIVLVIAFVADGTSWLQSLRQARNEASEHGTSILRHLRRSSDPILRAIVVEDSAALIGVAIAAIGLLVSHLTGSNIPDAIASLFIGVLLALTAFGLARPLADYLVGRSLPEDQLAKLHDILSHSSAIDEVVSLQALYSGPEEVIVGAKVHPASNLTIEQLTEAMDGLDAAIRKAIPVVADVFLDVTTYRADNVPKDGRSGDGQASPERDQKSSA